jgi:hypothetical protein
MGFFYLVCIGWIVIKLAMIESRVDKIYKTLQKAKNGKPTK